MWANSSLSVYYFFFGDFESVQKAVALSTIFQGAKIMQIERKTKFIWIFLRCSLSSRQVSKIVQIFHASKYLRLFLLWTHCFYFVKGFDMMLILRLFVHFNLSELFSSSSPWSLLAVAVYWHISAGVLRECQCPCPFTMSAMPENHAGSNPMSFQTMRLSGEINMK